MLVTSGGARCPLCGQPGGACGPRASHTPVDIPTEEVAVGELRLYDVEINGVKTRMKLTAEDAERMGGTSVTSGPTVVESKSAGAESDQEGTAEEKPAEPAKKKAPARRNKARTASDKSATEGGDGGQAAGE